MSLLSRFFYKRPPDGLLEFEFFDRVYVFDYCFLTEVVVFVKMFNKSKEENERLADAETKKQEKEAAKERPMATVVPIKRLHSAFYLNE